MSPSILFGKYADNKKRGLNYFVYAFGGIGDNLMHYIRVTAHANGVSISNYSCAFF